MVTEDFQLSLSFHEMTSQNMDWNVFQQCLALSTSIFEPDTPTDGLPPTSQLSAWQETISLPEARLLCALNANRSPVGFFFMKPRTLPAIGYQLPHIWIACVDPNSRGLGIFPRLTEMARGHAQSLGYKEISANTYPQRFTKMYRILSKNGWEEVCWPEKDVKVLMKLDL